MEGVEKIDATPTTDRIPQSSSKVNTPDGNSSKNIRHKSRPTVTSAPYISPTATSIVTDVDSEYKYTKADKALSAVMFKNEKGRKVYVNQHLTNYLDNPIKQEAIALVDELILTANYVTSEGARHKHGWLDNKGKNLWDIWTTYLQEIASQRNLSRRVT